MAFNVKETYRDNCPPPRTIALPPTIAPPEDDPPQDYSPPRTIPPTDNPLSPPRLLPPMTISCPREAVTVRGGIVRVRGIVLGGNGSGGLSLGAIVLGAIVLQTKEKWFVYNLKTSGKALTLRVKSDKED